MSPEVAEVIYSQSNKLGMSSDLFVSIFHCFYQLLYLIFFASGIFSHGFTYSGHPVSCAVAIEALKIYKYVSFFKSSIGKF